MHDIKRRFFVDLCALIKIISSVSCRQDVAQNVLQVFKRKRDCKKKRRRMCGGKRKKDKDSMLA